MAIIATGSKTIIDLSDGKSLSCYLGANQPRTQIHDVNNSAYKRAMSVASLSPPTPYTALMSLLSVALSSVTAKALS